MPDYDIRRYRGRFALVWWDERGNRHRYQIGTNNPREAELLAPSLFAELTRPAGTTVRELWDAYTTARTGRAVTETMKHTWKALRERFGGMEAEHITVGDCRAHIGERRAAGIKDGTLHTELGHLRMVLLWAVKQGLIQRAPTIERPTKPRPIDRHLSQKEVYALIHACSLPHLKLFAHLAYGTAGRASAILDLTWDRCDFESGKIFLENPELPVPHKGRAVVPMNRTLRAVLTEARSGALSEYVVEWAGEKVGSVKKGLAAAGRRAGIAKVTPHMLRHSAAVRMAETNVPMEEIASYLGHSDVRITRRVYARFSPEYLANAASVLELDELVEMKAREAG